ncbi:MAG: dTDP-4-dehydrorhamnose reductase [Candidatus Omnitrophica bacterium]|nr:dTDP-4-dehydrorhamnose reductase [Candidatus Omnitrophota bacterium]
MTRQDDRKILITGAGGMLGTDLAAVLDPLFEVAGLEKRPVAHLSVPYDICDLTHARKTRDAILGHRPNVVIHAAALTDVDYCEEHHDEAEEHNVGATQNVADACGELGIPLIFFSTDYVFDGSKKAPYTETDTPCPVNFYGQTKLRAEQYILEKAARALIFRITWLYGIWGRSFPKAILRQAAEVKKMSVVNDQVGRPTYSWDVAQAMLTVLRDKRAQLETEGREIYNLGNDGTVSWADFARFILKAEDLGHIKVEDIPSTKLNRPAPRPLNSVLSLEKAQKVLGLKLRPWDEAVTEFLPRWKEVKEAQEQKAKAEAAEKENLAE